jgi:hypothetical protein
MHVTQHIDQIALAIIFIIGFIDSWRYLISACICTRWPLVSGMAKPPPHELKVSAARNGHHRTKDRMAPRADGKYLKYYIKIGKNEYQIILLLIHLLFPKHRNCDGLEINFHLLLGRGHHQIQRRLSPSLPRSQSFRSQIVTRKARPRD